jgi:predicted Rossmann fold flavoprotein
MASEPLQFHDRNLVALIALPVSTMPAANLCRRHDRKILIRRGPHDEVPIATRPTVKSTVNPLWFGDMSSERIVIVGGGAAGFFAALACAEAGSTAEIVVLERGPQFLSKVRISGGGRCNVTHALFNEREFATRYPRGEKALIGPFTQFQASDTVAWFTARGVQLKTESDGRMFPTTDSSQTIIDCLLGAARAAEVKLIANVGVETVRKTEKGFKLTLSNGEAMNCDRLLLAIGGCRTPSLGKLAVSLGHSLEPPVPSLFTFHIESPWLRGLAGVSVEAAEVSVADARLAERGALLVTHWGLSGPAILRLSAWGARTLHEKDYRFPLQINWLPHLNPEKLAAEFESRRKSQPARLMVNSSIAPLPSRLWEQLVLASGLPRDTRWSALSRSSQHQLIQQLLRTEFPVTGKSLNKDEFVTCGGVRLNEVKFQTMESRLCPGLFFAGEILDIDGITGGFNFQAAWTTGWLAGRAMAKGKE